MNQDQEIKNLLQNIIASYEARLQIIRSIIENTEKILGEFRTKREEMSTRLREALAKSTNLRKKDFDGMMGEILTVQAEREENTKRMLADFRQEEERVLIKLKSLLEQGKEIKIKDFKKMLAKIKNEQESREKNTGKEITSEIERMREEVSSMLTGFKKERDKIALEWQDMVNKTAKQE